MLVLIALIIQNVPVDYLWIRINDSSLLKAERNYSLPVPEAYMTTPDIIRSRGYPVEIHNVVTEDGYILEVHRIPHGRHNRNVDPHKKRYPVMLQHGLFATDHVFVINQASLALSYILADRGYDVWMPNSRGSTYSRQHVTLNTDDRQYWQYSWTEMGKYDVTASINYILNVTEHEKLSYVGHSLGCTLFYIAMIEQPQYNDKIDVMISLAPSTSLANLDNFLFNLIAPFTSPLESLFRLLGVYNLYSNDALSHRMLRFVCDSSEIGANLCQKVVFHIFGKSESFQQSTVDMMMGHYPAGGSLATFAQFLQNIYSGESFHRYDFGVKGNMEHYGMPTPSHYNLSLVTAPVYIFWGNTDPVTPPQDVAWLAARLGNLKASIQIQSRSFAHGDFLWSTQSDRLVFHPLAEILPPPYSQAVLSTSNLTYAQVCA